MTTNSRPFGVTLDEIVIIERINGDRAHRYPHDQRDRLLARFDNTRTDSQPLHFTDERGTHHYPIDKILGLHFEEVPNLTQARVQLWQDTHGNGSLYLYDPTDALGDAILDRLDRKWAGQGWNFRMIADRLINGTLAISEIANPIITDRIDTPQLAATYYANGDWVDVHTELRPEHRDGTTQTPTYVAGPATIHFIGKNDMDAADTRRTRDV